MIFVFIPFFRNKNSEIWVSCKFRGKCFLFPFLINSKIKVVPYNRQEDFIPHFCFTGENSFNGKIQSGGSKDSVSSSEGFIAKWLSDVRGMSVLHLKSNCSTLFVAPGSQFTGIHKKSVSIK